MRDMNGVLGPGGREQSRDGNGSDRLENAWAWAKSGILPGPELPHLWSGPRTSSGPILVGPGREIRPDPPLRSFGTSDSY